MELDLTGSRPLNILQVTSVGKAAFGVATYVLNLAREQKAQGHNVHFTTWADRPFTEELIEMGHSVHPIRVRAKYDPFAIRHLAKIIQDLQIDVVHCHLSTSCIIGSFAARKAGVPSISAVHGMSGKWSFNFSTHIIAGAEAARQHLIHQGVRPDRISTVCNSLRALSDLPDPETSKHKLGLQGAFPIYSSAGRITTLKGIDVAIRATALVKNVFPNVRYIACGEGTDMVEMKALVASLGLEEQVIFPGYVRDMREVLSVSDIFAFPSRKEVLPMAILEAMSVGLPIVATNVGGIPEAVTEEIGRLVPSENAASFAQAIIEIAESEQLRATLGSRSKARHRAMFTDEIMTRKITEVYERVIANFSK